MEKERIEKLESTVMNLVSEVSAMKVKINEMDKKIDQLITLVQKRNGYVISLIKLIIAAILAAFGINVAAKYLFEVGIP